MTEQPLLSSSASLGQVPACSSSAKPSLLGFSPPRRVGGESISSNQTPPAKNRASLVSRSPEQDYRAKVDLPALECDVKKQLASCRVLAQVVSTAVDSISGVVVGLQFDAAHVAHDEANPTGEELWCKSFVGACSNLKMSLTGLASTFSEEVLAPLREMQHSIEDDCVQWKHDLAQLQQYEDSCESALTESMRRKDKISAELHGALKEGETRTKGARFKWLHKKSSTKAETKLQHAAHAQHAAAEEVAARTDQIAAARHQRDQAVEALCTLFGQVSAQHQEFLQRALGSCARAWEKLASSCVDTAEHLHSAVSLFPDQLLRPSVQEQSSGQSSSHDPVAPARDVESTVDETVSHAAAEVEVIGDETASRAAAAQLARNAVPRLQLAKLENSDSVLSAQLARNAVPHLQLAKLENSDSVLSAQLARNAVPRLQLAKLENSDSVLSLHGSRLCHDGSSASSASSLRDEGLAGLPENSGRPVAAEVMLQDVDSGNAATDGIARDSGVAIGDSGSDGFVTDAISESFEAPSACDDV